MATQRLPQGIAEERGAEDKLAALTRELDADREEGVGPLGPTRFLSFGLSAKAGAARPAALAG